MNTQALIQNMKFQEVSKEEMNEKLNLLPPCRWELERGFEAFAMMEPLFSDIHTFYMNLGGRFFRFQAPYKTPYAVTQYLCNIFMQGKTA
ncbi:hypothetical protein [Acinetobacter sp. P1(2025)]|uniref:hypothetical protein n=1 Tax=Acinetobacter sp. P1(2025) TaxID=3446120 RepID=UPI003F5370D1